MTKNMMIDAELRAVWTTTIPSYRLWVNEELICERSFWPNPLKYSINEKFVVELGPGQHKLVLERIDPSEGRVTMHHVMVTDLDNESAAEYSLDAMEFDKFQTLTFNA